MLADCIQKRKVQAILCSFDYNLLPKMLTDFYPYMDQALASFHLWVVSSVPLQVGFREPVLGPNAVELEWQLK